MNESKNQLIKLSDLQELFKNKHNYFTNEVKGHTGVSDDGEGSQGEYNEKFKFYKHPGLPEGVFMRETWHTNSYGYDETITAIDFVEGKARTITVFEPI